MRILKHWTRISLCRDRSQANARQRDGPDYVLIPLAAVQSQAYMMPVQGCRKTPFTMSLCMTDEKNF